MSRADEDLDRTAAQDLLNLQASHVHAPHAPEPLHPHPLRHLERTDPPPPARARAPSEHTPVVHQHRRRQVQVQVWGQVGGPQRLPQAQHRVKRKLALELDEQPPAGGGQQGRRWWGGGVEEDGCAQLGVPVCVARVLTCEGAVPGAVKPSAATGGWQGPSREARNTYAQ